jgi:serine/threonine protein kinase
MHYLEAGTLKTKMEAGPLPFKEIDHLFSQLADALGYAHSHGVVHRDLKPANALVDEQGNIFLTDFGIAKLLESASPRLTQTDAIMGTPAYISPEQAKAMPVDRRSDIYSLGIILYEMVTGRVPFVADTPLAVILQHVSDPLPLPSAIKTDTPESIERVILKALAKEPNDRYATTAEFLSAWKRALEDIGTVRQPPERIPVPTPRTGIPASTPTHSKPVTISHAARKSGGISTGLIIGCIAVLCLVATVGGITIFGTGFLASLMDVTDVPIPTNTEVSVTPSHEPPPLPPGDIILQDDFSSSDQWGILSDSDNSVKYDGEALRIQLFKKNWFVWTTPNNEAYRNYHAEVTVTNNDGEETTSFGILCHKQSGVKTYYYLAMASDGEYAIGHTINGDQGKFLTNNDEWAYSDQIVPNKSSYRVGVDCGNGALTLYVDGNQIASVKDNDYTSGGVGVFAWSGRNVDHGDVTFDDFVMTTLE